MSDIAREAGVSVGHLYNFFESRDAIVEVFAQRELDKLREKNRFYRESNLSEEEICRQSVYELALTKLDKTAARLTFEILSESVVNPRIQRAVKIILRARKETAKIARVCKEPVEPLRRGKEKRSLFNKPPIGTSTEPNN